MKNFIIMNPNDNCATVLEDIPKHAQLQVKKNTVLINQIIPLGHKFALKDIIKGIW